MAGGNQRQAFRGRVQNIFPNVRLFPVPEFADRGDAFVPRTTLTVQDDMHSDHVPLENEPCLLHLHWCLLNPSEQGQVEALHQMENLLDKPEDFLLYDYYDTDSDAEEADPEDIDAMGLDLEDKEDENIEANRCSLPDKQERVQALVVGTQRKLRGDELNRGSTAHYEDHRYALEDFQHCKSPNKRTVRNEPEGCDRSKRFCNDHDYIQKDF